MRIIILLITVIFGFAGLCHASEHEGGEKKEKKEEPKKIVVKDVGAEEIKRAMDGEIRFFMIDTRDQEQFMKKHVLNAVNLPISKVNEENLAKVIPGKKERVVFYCEDSDCAGIAAAKALELGYEKVYNYRSGFADWENKSFPVSP